MYIFRSDTQAAARQAFVLLAFAHVDAVCGDVRGNHEDRLCVSAYGEPAPLAYGVELRPLVSSDDGSKGVRLPARLLYMMLAGAVGLRLEMQVGIVKRPGEFLQLPVADAVGVREMYFSDCP